MFGFYLLVFVADSDSSPIPPPRGFQKVREGCRSCPVGISVDSCRVAGSDMSAHHARTLLPGRRLLPTLTTDMCRGLALVATLAFVFPSARGWLRSVRSTYRGGNGFGTRTTRTAKSNHPAARRMSCCAGGIYVEEMWPHLAGKQTCASEAAGKVQGQQQRGSKRRAAWKVCGKTYNTAVSGGMPYEDFETGPLVPPDGRPRRCCARAPAVPLIILHSRYCTADTAVTAHG